MTYDKPNLSFSSLDSYSTCPFRWHKLYIEHKWEPASKYLLYGSAFHELLDKLYENEDFISLNALRLWPQVLDKEKLKKKYANITKKELLEVEANGRRDIAVFFELARRENILHPAIEHECALEGKYRQHTLKAKIDLVTAIRGGIGILDWKTGNSDRKSLMQLALYAVLYSKKTGRQVDWICPVYFRTNEMVYQAFDKEIQEEAGEFFSDIYEKFIKDTEYKPKLNRYCKTCSFNNLCGAYKK